VIPAEAIGLRHDAIEIMADAATSFGDKGGRGLPSGNKLGSRRTLRQQISGEILAHE
jgi:hypothetical protein